MRETLNYMASSFLNALVLFIGKVNQRIKGLTFTLFLRRVELNCDSKPRLQLLINPNFLLEQEKKKLTDQFYQWLKKICARDCCLISELTSHFTSAFLCVHLLPSYILTFLIPQFTSEPFPCFEGLSRTIPSRYSDSSSILIW